MKYKIYRTNRKRYFEDFRVGPELFTIYVTTPSPKRPEDGLHLKVTHLDSNSMILHDLEVPRFEGTTPYALVSKAKQHLKQEFPIPKWWLIMEKNEKNFFRRVEYDRNKKGQR